MNDTWSIRRWKLRVLFAVLIVYGPLLFLWFPSQMDPEALAAISAV